MSNFVKKVIAIQLICIGLIVVVYGILMQGKKSGTKPTPTATAAKMLNGGKKLKNGLACRLYKTDSLDQIPQSTDGLRLIYNASSTRITIDFIHKLDQKNFYIEFYGYIYSDQTVPTTFYLTGDDGAQLFINGQLIIDNSGQDAEQEANGEVTLLYGYNEILIKMYNNETPAALKLEYSTSSSSRAEVEPERLFYEIPATTTEDTTTNLRFESFRFLTDINPTLLCDVNATVMPVSGGISVLLPQGADVAALVPTFKANGKLFLGQQEIISGQTPIDLSQPQQLTLVSGSNSKTFKISARVLDTGLPTVAITTFGYQPITSKDKYQHATLAIAGGTVDYGRSLEPTYIDIKGRGNYSWTGEKKPYVFKFGEATSLLDLPPEKTWVLIASHLDLSLIRNYTAYETARFFTNLGFSPKMRFVDVFLNGEYIGNYMLGDHVSISPNKLDLTKTNEPDTGVILELEAQHRAEGKRDYDYFFTKGGWSITFKDPNGDDLTMEQRKFIREYYEKAEEAILTLNNYEEYIDVDSFVDWFLVETLFKNWDSQFTSSVYLHKDAGGKLKMGPVWDFDCSVANQDMVWSFTEVEGWEPRWGTWFEVLMRDPKFRAKFTARWQEMKPIAIDTIFDRIDQAAKLIEKSYIENFKVYPLLGVGIWPVPYFLKPLATQKEQTDFIKDWLARRIEWLDEVVKRPNY